MTSFSGVAFVLFCCVFRLHAFVKAAALRSIVLRYASAAIDTRASFLFFLLFSLEMVSLFSGIFCTITVFSLYGEYVVHSPLAGGVFLPCDHGLDYLHQLIT